MAFRPCSLSAALPIGASAAPPASPATRIVMLGTAGGAETRLKRIQSTTARVVNGAVCMIDVGDGALRQLMGHMRANHLDPEQIGALAKTAGVGRVVLHHLEPGLDSETPTAADRGYAAGVRGNFAGPVILPQDLQVIPLAKAAR